MLLLILTGLCFLVALLLWVIGKKTRNDNMELFALLSMVAGIAVSVMSIIILPLKYVAVQKEVNSFEKQKQFIEEVAPTLPAYDNIAITQTKIELNEWLYDIQYKYEKFGFIVFYPSEIKDLQPIK